MWLMLQQDAPEDFVLATGETHPVREFVEKSFAVLGITVKWRGTGTEEEGYDEKTGKVIVRVDPRYFRPAEVEYVFASHSCCRRGDSEADHGHCAQASPRRPREGGPAPWMEAQSRLPLAPLTVGAGSSTLADRHTACSRALDLTPEPEPCRAPSLRYRRPDGQVCSA